MAIKTITTVTGDTVKIDTTTNRIIETVKSTKTPTQQRASVQAPTQNISIPQNIANKVQQAFGRTPTETDIQNFKYNPTVFEQQLDQAIETQAQKTLSDRNIAQTKKEEDFNAQNIPEDITQKSNDEAFKAIEKLNLTDNLKSILRDFIRGYEGGVEDVDKIINRFKEVKSKRLDPFEKYQIDEATGLYNRQKEILVRQEQAQIKARDITTKEQDRALSEVQGMKQISRSGIAGKEIQEQKTKQGILSSEEQAVAKERRQQLAQLAETNLGSVFARSLLPESQITGTPGAEFEGNIATEQRAREKATLQEITNQETFLKTGIKPPEPISLQEQINKYIK